ncbi:chromate transporter [Aneurinibacillus tyrosinisolvens]|uniref:chromate transporter n=1 Tax=Aneurinibacillus tyrosinisolvens TaxID=1443435 RepID=UPI00063FD279|nr:chromate transporter [Aneurinibacillus tyrosinisolvens]
MSYKELFIGFFRAGILGYGGGPSMLPLIHAEAVKKYNWVDDEEFSDIVALGNALPGPIATKIAAYIGYKVKGAPGALVTIFAVSIPVLILMIGLLGFLFQFRHSPIVKGMTAGIQPVIGVMMGVMAYEFFTKAWQQGEKGKKGGIIVLTAASAILLTVFALSPAIIIGVVLAGAFLWSTKKQKNKRVTEIKAVHPNKESKIERSV